MAYGSKGSCSLKAAAKANWIHLWKVLANEILGAVPNTFVDAVSNHTKGLKNIFNTEIIPADCRAYDSGTCKANCFGYSSPSTNVKYDKIKVTAAVAIVSLAGIPDRYGSK